MMTTEELDDILIEQFKRESRRFNRAFSYDVTPDINNSEIISEIIGYGPFFCFKSKAVFLADKFNPESPESKSASLIKKYFTAYISHNDKIEDIMMVDLYYSSDLRAVSHTIGLLATASILSPNENISTLSAEAQRNSLDPETVATSIMSFLYFTILANPLIKPDDINKIFIKSWSNFYSLYLKRIDWLSEYGDKWKKEFTGVLLFEEE